MYRWCTHSLVPSAGPSCGLELPHNFLPLPPLPPPLATVPLLLPPPPPPAAASSTTTKLPATVQLPIPPVQLLSPPLLVYEQHSLNEKGDLCNA